MGKRKKKAKDPDIADDNFEADCSEVEESSSDSDDDPAAKYKPYFVTDYNRRYPEDSGLTDFVVFIESADEKCPISMRDMMSLSSNLKRFNKGVKYLKAMNKYKVGVHFEKAALANAFLNNKTFLHQYRFKASIPATGSEVTGVIQNVPANLSNNKKKSDNPMRLHLH